MTHAARRRQAACAAALFTVSCAAGSVDIEIPGGRAVPRPDFTAIWDAASASCRGVDSMDVMMVFSGRAGDTRLRRTRTRTAVVRPDALRIEGLGPFGALFVFVGQAGDATLVLPRDREVVRGASAADLLYSLSGLALEPEDVHALLTGCVVPDGVPVAARAYGDQWVAVDLEGGATVYVRHVEGEYVIGIGTHGDLVVEYDAHVRGVPRRARIQTGQPPARTDVSVELSRVNINTEIDSAAFTVTVPEHFTSITLDELRRTSPTVDQSAPADGRP